MKIIAAYYFLLLYTMAMCKPILPLIKDEIAHIFWKAEHLAKVHHHHGDHHAEHEIAQSEHEEQKKNPATSKNPDPISVHTCETTQYDISEATIHKQKFAVNNIDVSAVSLDKSYPPPKRC